MNEFLFTCLGEIYICFCFTSCIIKYYYHCSEVFLRGIAVLNESLKLLRGRIQYKFRIIMEIIALFTLKTHAWIYHKKWCIWKLAKSNVNWSSHKNLFYSCTFYLHHISFLLIEYLSLNLFSPLSQSISLNTYVAQQGVKN